MGMDFRGRTSSAVAKPLMSGSVAGIFAQILGVFSSIIAFF